MERILSRLTDRRAGDADPETQPTVSTRGMRVDDPDPHLRASQDRRAMDAAIVKLRDQLVSGKLSLSEFNRLAADARTTRPLRRRAKISESSCA